MHVAVCCSVLQYVAMGGGVCCVWVFCVKFMYGYAVVRLVGLGGFRVDGNVLVCCSVIQCDTV